MRLRNARMGALALTIGLALATAARAEGEGRMVKFPSGGREIAGYLAVPKGDGPFPAVVVIHEWWGLTDWIKQNADRLASEGYLALAVDLYEGKVTNDPGMAHELMRALDHKEAVGDLKAGLAYLQAQPAVARGQDAAAIGWCMGGGLAREFAQAVEGVGPTVICYGSVTTDAEQVAQLKDNPVLGIFGATDRGIPVAKVRQFADALKAQGTSVDLQVYEGAGHGFMRPGGPQYHEQAAADAWRKIQAFLATNLKRK